MLAIVYMTLFLLTGFYLFCIVVLLVGLFRIPRKRNLTPYSVSVVVAARNEQDNIEQLLHALVRQNYPVGLYDIIIADDMSDDDTPRLVKKFIKTNERTKIQMVRPASRDVPSPKKQAIELGIRHAAGDIILLTDADCVPPPDWVKSMVSQFTPDVGLVAGYSPCEIPPPTDIFSWLLALDTISLAAVAAGSSGWNYMATCNGRNLAYRKSVFFQVNGFSNIREFMSGDDDLLLQQIQKHTGWKTRYVLDPDAVVPTKKLGSFIQFFHQRIRHASKGLAYTKYKIAVLAAVYLFNLLLFLSVPAELLGIFSASVAIVCLLLKSTIEFVFLTVFAVRMKRTKYLAVFPLAEILHIPYVVVFGALGQRLKFEWKTPKKD